MVSPITAEAARVLADTPSEHDYAFPRHSEEPESFMQQCYRKIRYASMTPESSPEYEFRFWTAVYVKENTKEVKDAIRVLKAKGFRVWQEEIGKPSYASDPFKHVVFIQWSKGSYNDE